MPDYRTFFLNTASNIVALDLLEISHPYFSKTYRIVRNAIAGVTVTLEDASVKTFDYYPVKLTPSGAYNDMDQQLQISFGDLGTILPEELDRLLADNQHGVYPGALLGGWVDNTGQLLVKPFLIGQGGLFYVPNGATHLQMGINDEFMFDNSGNFFVVINGAAPVTVANNIRLYDTTGGLNQAYLPYAPTTSAAPISVAVTVGDILRISVSGTIKITGTGNILNGYGDPTLPTGVPGVYVPEPFLPKTTIKPTVKYRVYRSDDLTAPLDGPFTFEVVSIAFKKEGATLQCNAPRLNLVSTGEQYDMDRFPMLRGFL